MILIHIEFQKFDLISYYTIIYSHFWGPIHELKIVQYFLLVKSYLNIPISKNQKKKRIEMSYTLNFNKFDLISYYTIIYSHFWGPIHE